jgi:hypothetical protein
MQRACGNRTPDDDHLLGWKGPWAGWMMPQVRFDPCNHAVVMKSNDLCDRGPWFAHNKIA